MAAPDITWKKHASVGDASGSTITTLSLGTVTAGQWSDNVAVSVLVETNAVSNIKLWVADTAAVVNGSPVSLGESGKEWDFRGTACADLTGYNATALMAGSGTLMSAGNQLAADYRVSDNSLGAGMSIGAGANNSVGAGNNSDVSFLSVQPHASAYDGEHTQFSFQVGYDFT